MAPARPYYHGPWRRRSRGTQDVADQLDLLADLLELDGGRRSACSPTVGRRRASARRRVRWRSSPRRQAKDLPGIGETIEEKIVDVETGEITP